MHRYLSHLSFPLFLFSSIYSPLFFSLPQTPSCLSTSLSLSFPLPFFVVLFISLSPYSSLSFLSLSSSPVYTGIHAVFSFKQDCLFFTKAFCNVSIFILMPDYRNIRFQVIQPSAQHAKMRL